MTYRYIRRRVFYLVYTALLFMSGILAPYAAETYIPPQAKQYYPTIKQEQSSYFPELPSPAYFLL
jgi:hypothetical protein